MQLETPGLGRAVVYARQLGKYGNHTGMSPESIEAQCNAKPLNVARATDFAKMPFDITEVDIACMEVEGATAQSCELISA